MVLNYDTDEGTILSSINVALGGDWWEELSEDAQEKVHDALFSVMEHARQNKRDDEQRPITKQSSDPSEISAFVNWVASLGKTEYAAHQQLIAVINQAQKLQSSD